jgi:hypothetical protein
MNPIQALIKTTLIPAMTYKNGALIVWAIPISFFLDILNTGTFLGINLTFMILFMILITSDFFTGVIASRHLGNKIESNKIAYTFYKVLMYFLFFWLIFEINKSLPDSGSFLITQSRHTIGFTRNFIFIILGLREYISIGENLEKRFGKKPYIFTMAEKLAEIIERKVIKRFEDLDT